jgi:hypothetical protein
MRDTAPGNDPVFNFLLMRKLPCGNSSGRVYLTGPALLLPPRGDIADILYAGQIMLPHRKQFSKLMPAVLFRLPYAWNRSCFML